MTEFEQYKKGYSPPALQRKYGLTYVQGYELAQDFKRLQEQLDRAKKALCEASRFALSDEKDISKIYDIVHPVIVYLNGGIK